jgi:hypothetical protein
LNDTTHHHWADGCSVSVDIAIDASSSFVWDVIRDIYAVDTRLLPGFATHVEATSADVRTVTFANGLTVAERVVTLDDDQRTLVYQAIDGPMEHHRASQVVTDDGHGNARLVWTTQFAPARLVEAAGRNIGSIARLMKATIEQAAHAAGSDAVG